MTDEEKKTIENLKTEYEKLIKEDNILFPLYKSEAKRLLNLIEKQSKEIEELNKDLKKKPIFLIKDIYSPKLKEISLQDVEGLIEQGREEVKDKIKAEIEELQDDIKYSANPLSIDNSKFGIEVLQSLLEKE